MAYKADKLDGLVVQVENVGETAAWMQKNLFFAVRPSLSDEWTCIENGDCALFLCEGKPESIQSNNGGNVVVGIDHIAMDTCDIDAALEHCVEQNLELETDEGKPFFNANVFGTGTRFFNIFTPFGLKVEVCQRLDQETERRAYIVCGVSHIGISTSDMKQTMAFYEQLGFTAYYPIVSNPVKRIGPVLIAMMALGNILVELYMYKAADQYIPLYNQSMYALLLRTAHLSERIEILSPNSERIILR